MTELKELSNSTITVENLNIPHAKVQNGKAEKKKRKMNKRKKENKINILSFIFYMTD